MPVAEKVSLPRLETFLKTRGIYDLVKPKDNEIKKGYSQSEEDDRRLAYFDCFKRVQKENGDLLKPKDRKFFSNFNSLIDYCSEEAKRRDYPSEISLDFIDKIINAYPGVFNLEIPSIISEPSDLEIYLLSNLNHNKVHLSYFHLKTFAPAKSLSCLRDLIRTKKFLQAIKAAVNKLEKEIPGEINVIDAGCGAIPIFGLYAALCSSKVNATLLELNPASCEIAKELIKKAKLENRVKIINADAITYKPSKESHLIISETMDTALINEPLAQIMHNLANYSNPNAIKIPQYVSIGNSLIDDVDYKFISYLKGFGLVYCYPLLDIEWKVIERFECGKKPEKIKHSFTSSKDSYSIAPLIFSTVNLFDNIELGLHESFISSPSMLQCSFGLCSYPKFVEAKFKEINFDLEYEPGQILDKIDVSIEGKKAVLKGNGGSWLFVKSDS